MYTSPQPYLRTHTSTVYAGICAFVLFCTWSEGVVLETRYDPLPGKWPGNWVNRWPWHMNTHAQLIASTMEPISFYYIYSYSLRMYKYIIGTHLYTFQQGHRTRGKFPITDVKKRVIKFNLPIWFGWIILGKVVFPNSARFSSSEPRFLHVAKSTMYQYKPR